MGNEDWECLPPPGVQTRNNFVQVLQGLISGDLGLGLAHDEDRFAVARALPENVDLDVFAGVFEIGQPAARHVAFHLDAKVSFQ